MLIHTQGIVIRNVKYSDSGVISKIYTRNLGMQSFLIQGIYAPKAMIKPSLLQPMTILELVVFHNKIKDLQRLKEARPQPLLSYLPFDVNKGSIGLFMSEIIYKTIKEEEQNNPLFDFLMECIIYLDQSPSSEPLMPLYFMLELSKHLGFYPNNNNEENYFFHLKEGEFFSYPAKEDETIIPEHAIYLSRLLHSKLSDLQGIHIPKISRQYLLEKLCLYYSLHMPSFTQLKSLSVLSNTMKSSD